MTKRILQIIGLLVLLVCGFQAALAQSQIPITGHFGGVGPNPTNPTVYTVQMQLAYCGANIPRVFGTGSFVATTANYTADSSGLITGSIWPNDLLTCGGVAGGTRYNVSYLVNGSKVGPVVCFQVLSSIGTFNLDTAVPCAVVPPPPPPPGFGSYEFQNLTLAGFLQGTSANFTGDVTALSFHFSTAGPHFTCPGGQFATTFNQDFTFACATPTFSAPVISVFGRTGAVVAANGDYSFSLLAGQIADSQFQATTHSYPIRVGEADHLTNAPTGTNCGATAGQAITALSLNNAANPTCTKGNVAAVNLQHASNTTGCTMTTPSSYDTCTMSVTWPVAFPDNSYQFNCTGINGFDTGNSTAGRAVINGTTSTGKTAAGVTMLVSSQGTSSGNVGFGGMDCIAVE
jgi:hypothetical protein